MISKCGFHYFKDKIFYLKNLYKKRLVKYILRPIGRPYWANVPLTNLFCVEKCLYADGHIIGSNYYTTLNLCSY